jgi:hypothetical protein
MNKKEALVKKFADSVSAQSEAISQGDPVTGNKHAKKYIDAFKKLRSSGNEGRDALSVLLTDERADVRVMAASYLLRHCEEDARAVLEFEAEKPGLVAFGAKQALQRWEDGTWALDPED